MKKFWVVKYVRLHLYGGFIYRNLRHMGNEFTFCTVIYFLGQGLKRTQERKDKMTQ